MESTPPNSRTIINTNAQYLSCHTCNIKDKTVLIYKWHIGNHPFEYPMCVPCKDKFKIAVNQLRSYFNQQLRLRVQTWLESKIKEIEYNRRQLKLPLSNG